MYRKRDISKISWTPFRGGDEADFSGENISGLSVYEEGDFLFIEASLPGLTAKDVEVYNDHDYIVIEGKREEGTKERKYYRKASASFNYRLSIPSAADQESEPDMTFKNGLMKLKFKKKKKKT